MTHAIQVRDSRRERWYSDGGLVDSEKDARGFTTPDHARRVVDLCGLYDWLGYQMRVVKSTVARVNDFSSAPDHRPEKQKRAAAEPRQGRLL